MGNNTRTMKSTKNVTISMIIQVGQLIINFIGRTIFIKTLGVEYLGINGLFTNILTLLSLAELGFGNAIIYSMYKPLAEKNETKLAGLMNFYKKIYRKIAILVFLFGILLIPFLPNIVSTNDINISINTLRCYYLLFLINSVASYLFVYKTTIISADQKIYLIKKYTFIALCIENILQAIILFLTHNFVLYLIIQILYTLGSNLYGAYKAKKLYPYIDNNVELENKEKKKIYKNVGSIFIYKMSGTILNNTDNILISILVSTILVGYYSNYLMIINAMLGIITMIFNAVTASVGNLNAKADNKHKKSIFEEMTLICFWIMGITSICLINGLNDFINIWIGEKFVLEYNVLLVIVINYYIYGTLNPIWVFRDTTGIFKDARNVSILLAILNIILSIILGKVWGIFGILLATVISRMCTSFWYQPYILYKKIFKANINKYYITQVKYILILIITYFLMLPIMKIFTSTNLIIFIIKMLVCFILSSLIIFIFTSKDKEAINFKKRLGNIIDNVKNTVLKK